MTSECLTCGYPRWRKSGHASWCEPVRAEQVRARLAASWNLTPIDPTWVTEAQLEAAGIPTRLAAAVDQADGVCGNGHERTAETTYVDPSGRRRCRACTREARRRRAA